jgi:hypothetical protein
MIPALTRKIDRYRRFYQADHGLMVLIWWMPEDVQIPPSLPIDAMDWADERAIRRFAGRELERLHVMRAVGEGIDDDKIPTAMVFAGTGMLAAALVEDAALVQQPDTNYLHPPLVDWQDGLDRIGFRPDNPWYQAQMLILRTFIEAWDGSFGIMPFAHFGPTDLANQLRGNALFTDLYEDEEQVHALLACCTEAILATEADVRAHHLHGYDAEGFTFGSWAPCGGYLSCDFGDLVSPAVLRTFERPYFDRIVSAWGGAYLHHHELGRHQIPVWAENDQVWIQFVHRDLNTRHLATVIDDEIIAASRRAPIQFISTYDEFMAHAAEWAQGRFLVEVACETRAQVDDVLVRARQDTV